MTKKWAHRRKQKQKKRKTYSRKVEGPYSQAHTLAVPRVDFLLFLCFWVPLGPIFRLSALRKSVFFVFFVFFSSFLVPSPPVRPPRPTKKADGSSRKRRKKRRKRRNLIFAMQKDEKLGPGGPKNTKKGKNQPLAPRVYGLGCMDPRLFWNIFFVFFVFVCVSGPIFSSFCITETRFFRFLRFFLVFFGALPPPFALLAQRKRLTGAPDKDEKKEKNEKTGFSQCKKTKN